MNKARVLIVLLLLSCSMTPLQKQIIKEDRAFERKEQARMEAWCAASGGVLLSDGRGGPNKARCVSKRDAEDMLRRLNQRRR